MTIHVYFPCNPLSLDFLDLIESFSLNQTVKGATHSNGHILDLVLTSGFLLINVNLVHFYVSDHKAIVFNVSVQQRRTYTKITQRK